MNTELITIIMQAIIIPAIPVVVAYLARYLRARAEEAAARTDNEIIAAYLQEATEAVLQAVVHTAQVYVDDLKRQGKFDLDAQRKAFHAARDVALRLLSQDARDMIRAVHGDVDLWLNTKIEQMVNDRKTA